MPAHKPVGEQLQLTRQQPRVVGRQPGRVDMPLRLHQCRGGGGKPGQRGLWRTGHALQPGVRAQVAQQQKSPVEVLPQHRRHTQPGRL